jgi:tetratricopeptide (TPR) repeat protein
VEDIGLHNKLEITDREFHIHTGTLIEQQKIISEVFERGMFLISREIDMDVRSDNIKLFDYDFLNSVTQEFHQQVIDEIGSLYQIEEKLRKFRHPKSHYRLGVLFLKRNLYNEGIQQFKLAIELEKDFTKALIGLGISYLKTGKFKESLETFGSIESQTDNYPDVINYHGLAQLFLGEYDKAMSLFKDAIQLNPKYAECQFNLGIALYKSALDGVKDPKAVAVPARVSIYLKEVQGIQKYRGIYWEKDFNQLHELLKDNNHKVIMPQLERFQLKLVDIAAEKDKIYEFYLRFLFGGRDIDSGMINIYQGFFENNATANKKYPDYWNDRGIFNLIKSRSLYLNAINEFEKAIELSPNFTEAKKNLEKIISNEKGFMILLRAILK